MLLGELATIAKYELDVKVVVIKNNSLGQIRWEQLAFEGNPQFGVDLYPIDFAGCARACGIDGYSVEDPAEVEGAISQMMKSPGPALLEALVDNNEPPLPGHISMSQALKFAQAMARGERGRGAIIKNVLENKIREIL